MFVARLWLLGIALVVFLGSSQSFAQSCSAESIDKTTIEARGELMAPCCWKDTLANHSSPRSDELSAEVRRLAEQCKSKEEILDAFAKKHGETILARPRVSGFGLWFYAGPAVLLMLTGLLLAKRWLPKLTVEAAVPGQQPAADEPIDEIAQAELDALFEQELKRMDR